VGFAQVTERTQPRRRRRGLSREGVARSALDLLDREGLEALSMRRLAEDLGAGTMTLYGYFRNKEDLLDAVIDAGFADFELPPPAPTPLASLRDLALATRNVLHAHPALAEIRGDGPIVRPQGFRITEIALDLLTRAGLEAGHAARVYRLLFDYVFGFAIVNRRPPSPALRREALASMVALPPEEFPIVTGAREEIADAVTSDAQFEYGLDLILDGLRARLGVTAPETTSSPAAPGARRRGTGPRAR
jgi:AcrR family transcriptional regulator